MHCYFIIVAVYKDCHVIPDILYNVMLAIDLHHQILNAGCIFTCWPIQWWK